MSTSTREYKLKKNSKNPFSKYIILFLFIAFGLGMLVQSKYNLPQIIRNGINWLFHITNTLTTYCTVTNIAIKRLSNNTTDPSFLQGVFLWILKWSLSFPSPSWRPLRQGRTISPAPPWACCTATGRPSTIWWALHPVSSLSWSPVHSSPLPSWPLCPLQSNI